MNPAQPPHTVTSPLFALIVPVAWVLAYFAISFVLSRLSGWSLLARRFRAPEPWNGESWKWQSARFRGWCNFNNCLVLGAGNEALYLSITPLVRLFTPFNPPLLIPWSEIEVETGKLFFGWYDTAILRLGGQERVGVRVYGKLVNRLRQAAGPGWPLYHQEQIDTAILR